MPKNSLKDFATATAQINSIMNNRPITKLSDNPDDVRTLSPAQIMTGVNASGTPSEFLTPLGYRRSFKMLKESVDSWWKRWSKEYLRKKLILKHKVMRVNVMENVELGNRNKELLREEVEKKK